MPSNVAMSVLGAGGAPIDNTVAYITVGNERLRTGNITHNTYWLVTWDRRDLKVVGNESFQSNSEIPASAKPYVGNPDYFFALVTFNISGTNLPTGEFFDFLVKAGAGTALTNMEQIFEQIGTASLNWPSYILVTTMEPGVGDGLEAVSYQGGGAVLALQLVPVEYEGETLYTPARATAV